MSAPRARRDGRPDPVVEANQSDGVTLAEQEQGDRGGQTLGVGEFGKPRAGGRVARGQRRAAPRHRATDVEDDRGAQIGFFFELPDDPPVGARRDLPIQVSQVVARLIGTIIGELHRESASCGTVKTGHETIDDPTGNDLDPSQ